MSDEPWLLWIAQERRRRSDGRQDVEVPADLASLGADGLLVLRSRWTRALPVDDVVIGPDGDDVRFVGVRVLPHDDAETFEVTTTAVLRSVVEDLRAGLSVGDEIVAAITDESHGGRSPRR